MNNLNCTCTLNAPLPPNLTESQVWVIILPTTGIYQYQVINLRSIPYSHIDNRRNGCAIYKNSLPSTQFFSEFKTVPKNKVYFFLSDKESQASQCPPTGKGGGTPCQCSCKLPLQEPQGRAGALGQGYTSNRRVEPTNVQRKKMTRGWDLRENTKLGGRTVKVLSKKTKMEVKTSWSVCWMVNEKGLHDPEILQSY